MDDKVPKIVNTETSIEQLRQLARKLIFVYIDICCVFCHISNEVFSQFLVMVMIFSPYLDVDLH